MAVLNRDGLEPGQPVEFETLMRIERQRGERNAPTDEAPERSRKAQNRKSAGSATPAAQEADG